MTFANLPLGWVLAGVAGLAAVLFALQRLRVRHREVTVVTTLFWQEAVQEARARVLVDRFRHPLAYLLVLLVASLVWLAAAEPRFESDDGRDHVLLLDASATMARDGWFESARDELIADAAWAPRDRTTVVLCGATPRTVLLPGESLLLLERRLEGVTPERSSESVTSTIRELAHAARDVRDLSIRVHGESGFDAHRGHWAQPDGLEWLRSIPDTPSGRNHGVTALGVAEAASGAWAAVDVLVEVRHTGDAPQPTATLDGTITGASASWPNAAGDGTLHVYRDVPANGGTFTVTLPGDDALEADDAASRLLPARSPIAVAVPDDAPPALLAALSTDPAVRLVAAGEDADVRVTRDADTDAPALVLVGESAQEDAIVVTSVVATDLAAELRAAYDDLALSQVDATSLATTAGRPVRLGARLGSAPQVHVWESLLTDRYDLIGQRAFPAFVARAVRRAAGAEDILPVVAVGASLPRSFAPLREPFGGALDPGDGELRPVVAGRHVTSGDAPLDVALLAPRATIPVDDSLRTDTEAEERPAPPDLAAWAAFAALGLLCAEWVLYRRGRIP